MLWDKRNVIFHEASKECYMFHETAGHLIAVGIKLVQQKLDSSFIDIR